MCCLIPFLLYTLAPHHRTSVFQIEEMQAVKIQGNNLCLEHLPLPSHEEGIKLANVSSKVFDEASRSTEVSFCKIDSQVS